MISGLSGCVEGRIPPVRGTVAYTASHLPLSVRNRTDAGGTGRHSRRMTHPFNAAPRQERPGTVERGEYLIDGHRVSFLHQADWNCACREFSAIGVCRHTKEARGMREAQALIRSRKRQLPGTSR